MHAGGFESKKWRFFTPESAACDLSQCLLTILIMSSDRSCTPVTSLVVGAFRFHGVPAICAARACGPPQAQGEGGEATAAHMHADVAHSLQLARTDRRSARCACPPRSPFRLRFLREASVALRTLFSTAVDSSLIAPSASPGVVPPPP